MRKIHIIYISAIIISFVCGCLVAYSLSKSNSDKVMNVFGTYLDGKSTLSIKHDLTYQYTYPFTSGKIEKIDEQTYKLSDGSFNSFIAIFSNNTVKLIDSQNNTTPKSFEKDNDVESNLEDHIME